MNVEFIVVGQGLAGSLLAHELFRHGISFLVIDDPQRQKSTNIAAGLVNPVVFKRMTKSWMVDEAFPHMNSTFRDLEDLLEGRFYFPTEIHRILTEEDKLVWKEKAIVNQLETYQNPNPAHFFRNGLIEAPFGIGVIHKAARVDLPEFIKLFSTFLRSKCLLLEEKFEPELLRINSDNIHYKQIKASKIIFCEGASVTENQFFQQIRFKHSKGEVLDLQIPLLKDQKTFSKDVFLMPYENNCFKLGATYKWDPLDTEISEDAKNELTSKLENFLIADYKIIGQKAGIRPTAHDRKPIAGFLPDNPRIGIFNGLGSKGVLHGPFFAKQFVEFINGKLPGLLPEVHINRYFTKKA